MVAPSPFALVFALGLLALLLLVALAVLGLAEIDVEILQQRRVARA